jgi:hypothetical protein
MMRPAAASDTAMWPLQPEPLARPQQWQPMEETSWPAAIPEPVPVARNIDRPAASFATDSSRSSSGDYGNSRSSADFTTIRSDAAAGRPTNEVRRPAPAASPPAPPPAPSSTDEHNLAEMAHRLEAALRRPPAANQASETAKPAPAPEPMARHAAADHARPLPEPRHAPVEPKPLDLRLPDQKPPLPKQQGSKSVYDSLEQEMASLLGRPSGKS